MAAALDRELAQLALTRVRVEVFASVRHGYFAALASQESMRLQEALTKFADDAYRGQVERAKAGQATAAEPLPFRALAYQARAELIRARNRYLSAWKQLASAVGRLDLQPSLRERARIDRPLPAFGFRGALHAAGVLYAEIQWMSPPRSIRLDKAQTTAARNCTSAPLLAFGDRAATDTQLRADLARAEYEPARVRARLTAQLAEAYERYDNQRRILLYYRRLRHSRSRQCLPGSFAGRFATKSRISPALADTFARVTSNKRSTRVSNPSTCKPWKAPGWLWSRSASFFRRAISSASATKRARRSSIASTDCLRAKRAR